MMTGWVQYEQWNADGFVREGVLPVRDIQKYLREFELAAKKLIDETDADHVVYAWKKYNEHGELCKICFYEGTVLDDEKFYDRTDKLPAIVTLYITLSPLNNGENSDKIIKTIARGYKNINTGSDQLIILSKPKLAVANDPTQEIISQPL